MIAGSTIACDNDTDYYNEESTQLHIHTRRSQSQGRDQPYNDILYTIIFFACFPFFSESLCDKNSTSVAKAPASRCDSG